METSLSNSTPFSCASRIFSITDLKDLFLLKSFINSRIFIPFHIQISFVYTQYNNTGEYINSQTNFNNMTNNITNFAKKTKKDTHKRVP